MSDIKERRKALGWNRAELAKRAALDKNIVQLIELDQWSEDGALGRVQYVLRSAEAGYVDIQLEPVSADDDDLVFKPEPR
jgi:hypothetical protein